MCDDLFLIISIVALVIAEKNYNVKILKCSSTLYELTQEIKSQGQLTKSNDVRYELVVQQHLGDDGRLHGGDLRAGRREPRT